MNEIQLLKETFGQEIMQAFARQDVSEIMVNPDNRLIIEDKAGKHVVGQCDPLQTRHAISVLCQLSDRYISQQDPSLTIALPDTAPFYGARAQVMIPPMVKHAAMTIRKHLKVHLTLDDFLSSGVIDEKAFSLIKNALINYQNILIAGQPKSGKTTLTKAILNSLPQYCNPKDRILVLEDTPEIDLDIEDVLHTTTEKGVRTMSDLVSNAVRSRPDRIIVGEVIDGAAYGLLQAWNTGCPGGISTLHANSCQATLQRLIDLCLLGGNAAPHGLIETTVQLIIFIEKDSTHSVGRSVTEIATLKSFDAQKKQFQLNTLYKRN